MRRNGLIFLLFMLTAVSGYSQGDMSLAVVTGYTMSAFEDQEDAAGTLPIGVQFGYMASPNLQVGAEFNTLLGGLTWEATDDEYTVQTTFKQTIIAAYAKYLLGQGDIKPFVKAGVGYFMGNADVEVEYLGETAEDELEIDPAIGFIVGGGVNLTPNIFAEFNYNIVSRKLADSGMDELDGSSSEKMGMNTWSVLVGYKINL